MGKVIVTLIPHNSYTQVYKLPRGRPLYWIFLPKSLVKYMDDVLDDKNKLHVLLYDNISSMLCQMRSELPYRNAQVLINNRQTTWDEPINFNTEVTVIDRTGTPSDVVLNDLLDFSNPKVPLGDWSDLYDYVEVGKGETRDKFKLSKPII
jgi:hypothetical protein